MTFSNQLCNAFVPRIEISAKMKSQVQTRSPLQLADTQRLPSPDLDRGWAWMVVFISWIGHLLVYGPSWSSGILYIEFLEEFEELPSVTAWIGTISAACTLFGGKEQTLGLGGSQISKPQACNSPKFPS